MAECAAEHLSLFSSFCRVTTSEQEESEQRAPRRAPRICLFTSRLVFRRHFALVPQNFSTFTIMLAYTSLCVFYSSCLFYRITIYTLASERASERASESNPPWLGCKLCLQFFPVCPCRGSGRERARREKCVQKRRVAKTGKFIWICGCWMYKVPHLLGCFFLYFIEIKCSSRLNTRRRTHTQRLPECGFAARFQFQFAYSSLSPSHFGTDKKCLQHTCLFNLVWA